jgi:hypothetical protein
MEAAFAFFPAESLTEVDQLLARLSPAESETISRMRQCWIAAAEDLTPARAQFFRSLYRCLPPEALKGRLVGENRWFRALCNDAGMEICTLVRNVTEMPTEEDLQLLIQSAGSYAYRRAIDMVINCRFLIFPEGSR